MNKPEFEDSIITRRSLLLRLKTDGPAREVAWQEFHSRYAPIIGGFARKMGLDAQEIPDLVQDVLLGFFSASPIFQYNPTRGRFRGYLKVCTLHTLQDHRRKRSRFGQVIDTHDVAAEQAWNDVWETERLQRAMEVVRKNYQSRPDKAKTWQAFELYVLLGRSPEEVAAELRIKPASVHQAKRRISQAIKATMQRLDDTIG